MKSISIQTYHSPYGDLIIGSYDGQLCICDWKFRRMRDSIDKRIQSGLKARFDENVSDVIDLAIKQLDEYFRGMRKEFSISLLMVGSAFQIRIWNELVKIPYGETETYLGLSEKLGDAKAIRAVAAANGANAISIFVPCHRIIGSKGELTGYAGGLDVKKKLLLLENSWNFPEQLNLF